jgi:hypothetical protein
LPLEPPARVLRLMRRIEMGTKLGIRSLRTGTSDSHARALGSRAREEARPPSPSYVGAMSDKPDPTEPGIPDIHMLPNEDGGADIYMTYLQEEDGTWLDRDLEAYKKRLRHDDPMRAKVLRRLRGQKLLKRLGVSVKPVRRDGRIFWQFTGPSQEAMEEALQWYKDHDYFPNLE